MGEELQGLGDLDGGGKVDRRGEDAGGIAGLDVARGRGGEDAGQARCRVPGIRRQGVGIGKTGIFRISIFAWRLFWKDVHGGGVGANGGGVDPGAVVADAEVVDEIAGFEVVGAVEDDIGGEELGGVLGNQVGDVGVDANAGVDAGEVTAGGFGFGESGAGVVFIEEHLALEVGGFDEVAVDEGEMADSGTGQQARGGCSGGADADDGDMRLAEKLLSSLADAGEEDLAGVAFLIGDGAGDGVCAGGGGAGGGKRRHNRSIRSAEGIWRGSGKWAATPFGGDASVK